jgi:hypothetical protein
MSCFTDGFLNKIDKAGNIELPRLIIEMYNHAVNLEVMLKRHEYNQPEDCAECCPECYGFQVHEPDCELSKLLE